MHAREIYLRRRLDLSNRMAFASPNTRDRENMRRMTYVEIPNCSCCSNTVKTVSLV